MDNNGWLLLAEKVWRVPLHNICGLTDFILQLHCFKANSSLNEKWGPTLWSSLSENVTHLAVMLNRLLQHFH